MKQDNINYFAVGLFVITAIVVLMVALYNITGSSTNADDYFVELKNVSGIRAGSPVTYAGYEIGKLADIEPRRTDAQTIYRLHLLVKADWQIPVDSTAQVVTPSLLSEKQIDITDGKSHEYLKIGGTIRGIEATDVFQLAQEMSEEFHKLSEDGLKPLLKALTEDIVETLPKLSDQSLELLTNLNDSAKELNAIMKTVDRKEIDRIMSNTDKMTDNLLAISRKLDATAQKIESMVDDTSGNMVENNQDLRKVLLDLRTSMGIVQENINNIVFNMDATARNMNEFSRQLRDNPSVLLNSKAPADAAKQ